MLVAVTGWLAGVSFPSTKYVLEIEFRSSDTVASVSTGYAISPPYLL